MFLHAWVENQLPIERAGPLKSILQLRGQFTREKFESLHCSWERLIRLARPDGYCRKELCEVYRLQLGSGRNKSPQELVAHCVVDAQTCLTPEIYDKMSSSIIDVSVNKIISPRSRQSPGWNLLLFYEAFPQNSSTSKRYVLPVFIQHKFSMEEATTRLSKTVVEKARHHCKNFLTNNCRFPKNLLQLTHCFPEDGKFVLLFIAKQNWNLNTVAESPPNVLFCFEEDIQRLYGPTLGGFLKYLIPDQTLYLSCRPYQKLEDLNEEDIAGDEEESGKTSIMQVTSIYPSS